MNNVSPLIALFGLSALAITLGGQPTSFDAAWVLIPLNIALIVKLLIALTRRFRQRSTFLRFGAYSQNEHITNAYASLLISTLMLYGMTYIVAQTEFLEEGQDLAIIGYSVALLFGLAYLYSCYQRDGGDPII